MAFIDEYTIKARQAPATIALAPAILATYALLPELRSTWGAIGALLAALGLPAGLAYVARSCGKRLEPRLFQSWGGKPTTAMLRWRDGRISSDTKRRYHDTLRAAGVDLPSVEDEERDPTAADAKYESAGEWMLRHARDKKAFPFVFTQNINYGFARNLLGLKWIGFGFAAACVGAETALVGWTLWTGRDVSAFLAVSDAVSIGLAVFWLWAVRPAWVHDAAVAYSRALLEVCESGKYVALPTGPA